jgi:hypothetical protein
MKTHIRRFLDEQMHPETDRSGMDVDLQDCPRFSGRFSVFDSAVATYYLPGDTLGQAGFYRERIRATAPVRGQDSSPDPQYDCVLVATDTTSPGFSPMQVPTLASSYQSPISTRSFHVPSSIGIYYHAFETITVDILSTLWLRNIVTMLYMLEMLTVPNVPMCLTCLRI